MHTERPPEASDERGAGEGWLNAEMDRIWLVAERCLRSFQRAGLRPPPDDPRLAEIEGIFAGRRQHRAGADAVVGSVADDQELLAALARVERRVQALREAAPLGRLALGLGLRRLELETLLTALAPHVDAPLSDVFALVRGPSARRGVDLALVTQLYQLHRADRVALLDALDPERPLLSFSLIQVAPPDSAEAYGSAHYRAIQPTFDLLSMLCGRGELPSALSGAVRLLRAPPTLEDLCLDQRQRQELAALCQGALQATSGRRPWLLLWGPRGVGKTEIAARVAGCGGRALLCVDPRGIEEASLPVALRRAQREAVLRGAELYLGPLREEHLVGEDLWLRLRDAPIPVSLGIESMHPPRLALPHPVQEVELRLPAEDTRLLLWERAVPEAERGAGLDLQVVSRGFHLSPGEILATAEEARAVAGLHEGARVRHEDLRRGIDRRLRSELGGLARRLSVTSRWEDLVLPQEDQERVREFIGRGLTQHQVYHQWGFGERVGYGKGLIALFSGPPGTGKTMVAGLIARALDLDLYQVDLSQVVSKWVGETEKQLARVFDEAERAHAVLLFDEADALFARRTEVKSSNDRYGNLSVNYLLQRFEQYAGVAVLTTNKEASLDEALARRLSLHLRLDVPGEDDREWLWRSMIPAAAPCADDIEFDVLARDYELTGGYIKNIVLRAAFLAASAEAGIDMQTLRRAARLELEGLGKLVGA